VLPGGELSAVDRTLVAAAAGAEEEEEEEEEEDAQLSRCRVRARNFLCGL